MEALGVQPLTDYRRRVVWGAAFVSGSLHLLMIWCWRVASNGTAIHLQRPASPFEIRLLTQPASPLPVPPKAFSSRPHARQETVVQEKRGLQDRPGQGHVIEDKSATPVAATTNSADAMIEAAKRDIGRIDRDLRQAFPTRPRFQPTESASPSSRLEKGIAAAGLPRGTTTQEMTTTDGRRITKVMTPSSTYCALGRKPGAGIDENERAAFVTTTCP